MNAPLLRERELFLVKKQSEGNGIRSLQMTADQLLFATLHLSLGNEGTIVSLSEIMVMHNNYDGPAGDSPLPSSAIGRRRRGRGRR